jgi:hypothetical protein
MPRPKKNTEPDITFAELPDHFGPPLLKKFLKCSFKSIYGLLETGQIPSKRIGTRYVIAKVAFGLAWGFISETKPETDEKAV